MTKDTKTSGFGHMINKTEDALGGMHGVLKAKTVGSHSADAFVKNAAIGDMYEISAAKVALQRSANDDIRQVAMKMIHDHTANTHHLHSALRMNETSGVQPPPKDMDSRRQAMLTHLHEAPDDSFDKTYLDQQVLAHKETLELMEGYRDDGDNSQLRSLAAGAAPVVKRHLERMHALQQAV